MHELWNIVSFVCAKMKTLTDWAWGFPTNLEWYASIPIIGRISLTVILLLGTGIYFSCRTRFAQVRYFKYGLNILMARAGEENAGISPLAAFLMSTAMRVGPGNILGVTGAIAVGGPGALFWMWVAAFFGMATAFVEATLSQLFKERKGDEFVGGLPYYGSRLLNNAVWAGVILSCCYIFYAFLCFPAQGFNTISAVEAIACTVTGRSVEHGSALSWITFAVLMVSTGVIAFGGIKKVSKVTDVLVPVMAVVYVLTVCSLSLLNLNRLPWFFSSIFTQAFNPDAVFGGALGVTLAQGIRRGLMSNEAGMGTVSMPAGASNAAHPVDQGCVQSLGVFLDTIICTLTGFVVIMGHCWLGSGGETWLGMDHLPQFLACCQELGTNGAFSMGSMGNALISLMVSFCFGLFAYTCLLGFISFAEICANRISQKPQFILVVRVISLIVVAFGVITNMVGLDLSDLWDISDFANLVMCTANIPLLYVGYKYAQRALEHKEKGGDTPLTSQVVGISVPAWDEKASQGNVL